MLSPFEELEWVADFLPEEGQAVVISRESGELVCKPHTPVDLRDGVDDAELYGRLVQMNDQLAQQNVLVNWLTGATVFWGIILVYGVFSVSTAYWYIAPCFAFFALYAAQDWSRRRRGRFFKMVIRPKLEWTLARYRVRPYALLAGVSHHSELRALRRELLDWVPDRVIPKY